MLDLKIGISLIIARAGNAQAALRLVHFSGIGILNVGQSGQIIHARLERHGDALALLEGVITLAGLDFCYESRGNEYYTPAEGNEYVILEFTVENGGEEEVTLSTMLSFSTWCDGKSCTISLEALGTATLSGKIQLDCVVAAGEKATGVLGYEVPADWQEISVKYTEEVMFGESAVFAVTREEE